MFSNGQSQLKGFKKSVILGQEGELNCDSLEIVSLLGDVG